MGQNLSSDFNRQVVCRLGKKHPTPTLLLLFGIPGFVGILKETASGGLS